MSTVSVPLQRLKVASTILFHSISAIAVTLVSKSALNQLDAPVTLLFFQTAVQTLLVTVVGRLFGWIRWNHAREEWLSLLPLALARTIGVLAKTFCLAAVDASFYQIARGLLLPFTLILSALFLGKTLSAFPRMGLVGVGIVISGFLIGITSDLGRMKTTPKGIAWGIGSSLTTAIEAVVVKKFLSKPIRLPRTPKEGGKEESYNSMIEMVWMSNILALGLYVPVLLITGESTQLPLLVSSSSSDSGFLKTTFFAGVCGFALTIATFLQISVTSPTTHMVVTAARGVAQSGFAVLVLREGRMGQGRICSMVYILSGSAIYGWAEDRALQARNKAAAVGGSPVMEDGEKGQMKEFKA